MKKSLIYFVSTFAILCGCSKSLEKDANNYDTIVCETPSHSKTYIDGLQVKWHENDKLHVVNHNTLERAVYTLSEGKGTTKGVFIKTSGTPSESVAAFHLPYTMMYNYGGKNYIFYDIPQNPALCGYDSATEALNNLQVPMMAVGSPEDELVFYHIASALRLKIRNETGASLNVSNIKIEAEYDTEDPYVKTTKPLVGRMAVNTSTWEDVAWVAYSYDISTSASSTPVEIGSGGTKYFDFVVRWGYHPWKDLKVTVSTAEGDKYEFNKAGRLDVNRGDLLLFDTKLNANSIVTQ